MIDMPNKSFREYYNDNRNLSPAERAKIEFEIELFGKLIAAREAKGMTLERLAEAAGVKQSTMARLYSLKTTPRLDTLFKIITPLGYKLTIAPFDDNARSG
jgi:DNA-binding phage protein